LTEKELEFEIVPIAIYQTFKLQGGQSNQTFTFGEDNTEFNGKEILSTFGESEITRRLLSKDGLCREFFRKTGINYPNCWFGIEIKKEELINDWPYPKPGDIDIIAGNYIKDSMTIDWQSLTSYQIKIRKIREFDDLKSFGYGTGTEQTEYTSKMGFNKNYLFHIIIREPREIVNGQSTSWRAPHNADFFDAFKASYGLVKDKIKNKPFGYGLLGWGQATNMDWRISGAFSLDIMQEAPFINDCDSGHRDKLVARLKEIFSEKTIEKPVIYCDQRYCRQQNVYASLG
jgi:hypothetical protein